MPAYIFGALWVLVAVRTVYRMLAALEGREGPLFETGLNLFKIERFETKAYDLCTTYSSS